ncbi:ATP-dependent DNA helicase RecQ [Rhodothalassium salexigens DSM 2132]|uniref:DNA helicase RecQ n=1 Tax=Rhodothalassium salexigens DSM 2132 TaxID=1188247 RepID=A0A4R2PFB7_RHOSA|nr:DNA helicase RecQ [Rhodothalassium salexigens]MBB4211857.1 ATP-dependent DNA helicase RecQ [Rhodothalassium salexigens DSM 2132]MBK1638846.1 DNA helicase RecQ [Rhodothalassium salexigens DSM 2132]TCP33847.1 ATP-dependent DNA helicase RecQ [Rhodothalassium salexigens DSM 2132]
MPVAPPAALDVLKSVFGYPAFRPGQDEIIARLIAGTHCLCVMPTGAGKSLCYQIPALMADRPTVVVSPLTALMDDQSAGLEAAGVPVAAIHSGRAWQDNADAWRDVRAGRIKLIYLSPEKLMSARMLDALRPLDPAMFVVDEAHCISKWGAQFRPDYEQLSRLKELFPRATLAAFTATADAATRDDIAAKLFAGQGEVIVHGFDRPNIFLAAEPKRPGFDQLFDYVRARPGRSGIVYCLSRKQTEAVAEALNRAGIPALAYHAGMAADERRAAQERFMAEPGLIMAATIAFGMGIDKADIRYVFHLNLPSSMEAYYQEIGRAGRDGAPAEAMMLFSPGDIAQRRRFIEEGGGDDDHIRREHQRLDALVAYAEATRCRRSTLLAYFGQSLDGDDPEAATAPARCGHCDLCLDPPRLVDATREAQMLLSAMVRTGERYGASHLIDIVTGAETQKMRDSGHDQLPTYGVGSHLPKSAWTAFARQLISGGLAHQDVARFGGLSVTPAGWAVLRGQETFSSRQLTPPKRRRDAPRPAADEAALDPAEAELLKALKAKRKELAAERSVPAFVIFPDATLADMCRRKPQTLDDLALVSGVGPKKQAEFGATFLAVIRAGA